MKQFKVLGIILMLIFAFPKQGLGQELTTIMVRAHSKDAKFIGTSIGGAKVFVRDAVSGEILAEGMTQGSTGDTERIMQEPQSRKKQLTDENTAGFLAELQIEEPTFVTVEVIAPFSKKQASIISSTQLWVIPGKNISGDGIVLEVPGFVVDILSPQTHERIPAGNEVEIKANVVMMCGCPITEDGIWDSSQYEVKALISENGKTSTSVDLQIQEKPSTFSGKANLSAGNYEITVYAFDPETGNTGVDKTNILLQ
ncbi:hypothetical protein GCM10007103_13680 [Salinimicrobium marinum]|uniref:Uncharacterized protein n=1 Tax=Salinimicrobium marinum TaxID=680283 RepID=A0A918VY41_9FLAO|nr:hypothetical protein [Salinimicrobium marinum]GHA33397.1 hypothetical protein GCM10007103_13680 [Salinimicrobium marinum]